MTNAAIAEMKIRAKLNTSIDTWRKIAIWKTEMLFPWYGDYVGRLANDLDSAAKFYKYGCHLVAVFQMPDDIKDLYADLRNKEPSYHIILGLNNSLKIATAISELWSESDPSDLKIIKVGKMIVNEGFVEKTCEPCL